MTSDPLAQAAIPRQSHELVSETDLTSIVSSVWLNALATRLKPARAVGTAEFVVGAVLPMVRRGGRDSLLATLCVSDGVAVSATAATLGLRPDELAPADIGDTVAGLLRDVGAGICSRFSDVEAVGPVAILHGAALGATVPRARLVGQSWLSCRSGLLQAGLWRQRMTASVSLG